MERINSGYLKKTFVLLVVNGFFCVQLVNANEWQGDADVRNGYTGFSSANGFSDYPNRVREKKWSSGTSFNEDYRAQYATAPSVSKNPWKANNSLHYKKSFSSKRPWGNLPERKPKNSNMKQHDQKFKHWSHVRDFSIRDRAAYSNPYLSSGYGMPGTLYNSPLITPGIYPGLMINPLAYGPYSGGAYPYRGLSSRPWLW